MNLSNKNSIGITIAIFVLVSILYLIHTPISERSYDFYEHWKYTKIIVNEHRLPPPKESWCSYHPPLYYLINSFITPKAVDLKSHVNYVRFLSVLYGVLALLLIAWVIQEFIENPITKLLILLFIATTPKFVSIFSTYNNDSLSTLFCIGIIAFSYKLYQNWSWKLVTALLLTIILSLYTKYTTIFCITAIALCIIVTSIKKILNKKLPTKEISLISIFALAFIFFLPWLVFHNYHYTKQFFPTYFDKNLHNSLDLKKIGRL